jgi:hypothetical protein
MSLFPSLLILVLHGTDLLPLTIYIAFSHKLAMDQACSQIHYLLPLNLMRVGIISFYSCIVDKWSEGGAAEKGNARNLKACCS